MTNVLTDPQMVHKTTGSAQPSTEIAGQMAGTRHYREKPANLPDKFWNAEKGEIMVDALLRSYLELEKKLSAMVASPETEEGRTKVMRMLGVPEHAEDYEIDVRHGLFQTDPDVNRILHEKGFTCDQVQAVYDLAADRLVPLIVQMAEEFRADREVERLIDTFGGVEKWQEVSRQLLAFGKKNLPADVFKSMASSYDGVMMLYKMMKGQDTGSFNPKDDPSLLSENEQDIKNMMRDPRYWRDRDPSFVQKVTEAFQKMYPEKM